MKKLFLTLLILLSSFIALFMSGCETVENFADEIPQTYALFKGASKVLLLSQVPAITSDVAVQVALKAAIEAAFMNDTPQAVANALEAGILSVYPDDETLQQLIKEEFADVLSETGGTPESGGEREYQIQLSDELRN